MHSVRHCQAAFKQTHHAEFGQTGLENPEGWLIAGHRQNLCEVPTSTG
jgi:hypothetical protein